MSGGSSPALERRTQAIIGAALFAVAAVAALLLGANVSGWLSNVWTRVTAVPLKYVALACAFKALESVFVAIAWRAVLRAAYPDDDVSLKLTLGAYEGGAAINGIVPAQAGTWAMLGLYRVSIPGSRLATLVAALGVHSFAFWVIDAGIYALLYLTGPQTIRGQIALLSGAGTLFTQFPVLAVVIVAGGVTLIAFVARILWRKLVAFREQIAVGGAILHIPSRYLISVVLPTVLSYICRWASAAVLMAALGIPVTLRTVFLAVAARTFGGAIKVTPAGLGTNQLLEVIALRNYASPGVVTAYSLTQSAIVLAFTVVFGLCTLIWAFGWSQTKAVITDRRHGRS